MENASNTTNSSRRYTATFLEEYREAMKWTLGMEIVYMLVGTALNLWLLLSILTSRGLRVRLRNQLIVNLCIAHLLQTMVKSPILILKNVNILHKLFVTHEFFCHTFSLISIADFTQSFIADWLMVFIVAIFIANIMDLDLASKWTPQMCRICRVAMHLFPWIIAIIVTPIAISQATKFYPCLLIPYRKLYIFEIVYTVIPTGITVLLVVAAVVLRTRRFTRGSSRSGANMGIVLIGKGPEIDNTFAYMLAAAICIGCEICHLIFVFEVMQWRYRGLRYHMMSYLMGDSRVILVVFPWLLLPDIRQRIRDWRPWQRENHRYDLTITYAK